MQFAYNAGRGAEYAYLYADYFNVPEAKRLFFYDSGGSDCTNFCSQCVWAAYGGWVPGFDQKTAAENRELIKKAVRMAPFVWYGSLYFSGSNKWCRVMDFYDYCIAAKSLGPQAAGVYEGDWRSLEPSGIQAGDVIQMVVSDYTPYRYGHCLYVTKKGHTFDEIKICCHSYDRLNAPLSEFSSFPRQYPKLRVLRFKSASFIQ